MLVLGLLTRLAAAALAVNMAGAVLTAGITVGGPIHLGVAPALLVSTLDGKEFAAKLLSKEEARRRYEEIVRKNRDPALLEWVGKGMFQTSVFPIPAGAKRTVHSATRSFAARTTG